MREPSVTDKYNQLQEATMRQLDTIATEVEAGRLSVEEATKQSEALIKDMETRLEPLAQERLKLLQQARNRTRLLLVMAAIAAAYLVFKFVVLFTGPAP